MNMIDSCICTNIEGKIVAGNGSPGDISNIPVVLNGGEYRTVSRIDGIFRLYGIPSGTVIKILRFHCS